MKKLLLVPLVLLLPLIALTRPERYSWHQKLTITIETPAGGVLASSVSQVSWRKHLICTDGVGWSYEVNGEAVVVEVTSRHSLFALLKGAGTAEYVGVGRRRFDRRARGTGD